MFRIRKPNTPPQPPTAQHPQQAPKPSAPAQSTCAAQHIASLWTLEQVAVFLGVSYTYVTRLRAAGLLPPAIQLGNAVRWHPDTITRWALAHTERRRP